MSAYVAACVEKRPTASRPASPEFRIRTRRRVGHVPRRLFEETEPNRQELKQFFRIIVQLAVVIATHTLDDRLSQEAEMSKCVGRNDGPGRVAARKSHHRHVSVLIEDFEFDELHGPLGDSLLIVR
jgi:hypothetical protein